MLGCNLYCGFCWVPDEKKVGCSVCNVEKWPFQSPQETYAGLRRLAVENGLVRVRVSGCEPLINKRHLLSVIRMAVSDRYYYVLDTNGLLLDDEFLASIKPFRDRIYIYMGLKGSSPKVFQEITTAAGVFWYKQLEALRLIIKHGFTLGVNVMANFTPAESLPKLLDTLEQISPILPMCVDMKQCTFFTHNSERIKQYNLAKYSGAEVKGQWSWMLGKKYDPELVRLFQVGETSKAFDNYELQTIYKQVEWNNGLKFVKLPKIPFKIPFSNKPLDISNALHP